MTGKSTEVAGIGRIKLWLRESGVWKN